MTVVCRYCGKKLSGLLECTCQKDEKMKELWSVALRIRNRLRDTELKGGKKEDGGKTKK